MAKNLSQELAMAFQALDTYGNGSKRSALLPIDEAVRVAAAMAPSDPQRKQLEERLAMALVSAAPDACKEYVCSKLVWLATKESAEEMARLLGHRALDSSARTVLEQMPDSKAAARILKAAIPRLKGDARAAAENSLHRVLIQAAHRGAPSGEL